MAKSQMEIMGLMVVVVLMILGMLFVVRFIILKPDVSIKQSYTDTVLAANLKNSLLLFSTNCQGKRIQDLLSDCVSGSSVECPADQGSVNLNSCSYAQKKIEDIFSQTLVKWNRQYKFEACLWKGRQCDRSFGDIVTIVPSGKTIETACKNQEIESKFSPIQTQKGIMKVTLQVCRDVVG